MTVASAPASSRPHIDIKSLPSNGFVDGVYSILNPQIGTTRGGQAVPEVPASRLHRRGCRPAVDV